MTPAKDSYSEYVKNYGLLKREPNREIAEEDIQMVIKHTKRYSASLVIREMHIKITMSYYYTLTRVAKMRKIDKTGFGVGSGATRALGHCWSKGNLAYPVWKPFGRICKAL